MRSWRTSAKKYLLMYLLFASLFLPGSALSGEHHVATDGSPSGDGSLVSPWDLQSALNHPSAVRPGDTIWVHGGTYDGDFVSRLSGVPWEPIIVRNYDHERVTLRGGTEMRVPTLGIGGGCDYAWFWGLEITSSGSPSTLSLKVPSLSTTVPVVELAISKAAPAAGSPVSVKITSPFIPPHTFNMFGLWRFLVSEER